MWIYKICTKIKDLFDTYDITLHHITMSNKIQVSFIISYCLHDYLRNSNYLQVYLQIKLKWAIGLSQPDFSQLVVQVQKCLAKIRV